MKPVSEMKRLELAAFIAAEFRRRKINVVLSGGSCVSIYSAEKYVSMDLDFVNAGFAKRASIREAMEYLGFSEENRYFRHPETELPIHEREAGRTQKECPVLLAPRQNAEQFGVSRPEINILATRLA